MNEQIVYVVKCGYPFDGSSVQDVYENVLDAIENCERQLLSNQKVWDRGRSKMTEPSKLEWLWYAQNRYLPQSITLAGLDRNGFECIWTVERRNVIRAKR